MQKIKLSKCFMLLATLSSLSPVSTSLSSFNNDYEIKCKEDIGPYEVNRLYDEQYHISLVNHTRKTIKEVDFRLYIEAPNFISRRMIYMSNQFSLRPTEKHSLISSGAGSYMRDNGLFIEFSMYVSNVLVHSISTMIYPLETKPDGVNNEYLNKDYESLDKRFRIVDNSIYYVKDKASFKGIKNFIDITNDYQLDLSMLYFTFKSAYESKNIGEVYLYPPDEYFPYLNHKGILLNYISNKDEYRFYINSTFYYDPKSLEISLEPRLNFKSTNKFYFPRNKLNELHMKLFKLEFKNFGFDQANLTFDLKYYNTHFPFGDCSDSDYCIIGGHKR